MGDNLFSVSGERFWSQERTWSENGTELFRFYVIQSDGIVRENVISVHMTNQYASFPGSPPAPHRLHLCG